MARTWVLGITLLVVAVDGFVMLKGPLKISQDLHASSNQLLWTTDLHGFLLAGFLITIGTFGGHIEIADAIIAPATLSLIDGFEIFRLDCRGA